MNAALRPDQLAPLPTLASPFDLDDEPSYQRWRAAKLAAWSACAADPIVTIADPRALTAAERETLLQHLSACNQVVYRGPPTEQDPSVLADLAAELGLRQLDANWLADEDGISHITQSGASDGRGGFIPYTDRAIGWHTDGYYHPAGRRIRSMLLHCVRPAREGGLNTLIDPELAYIALRDEAPGLVRALMAPEAMVIPAREDDDGVARPAQAGPVFSVDAFDGRLHMRYTARSRSIAWADDGPTRRAAARLQALLAGALPQRLQVRLAAGMGVISHNVLHDRSAFVDDPARPRLLYRARYLDLSAAPELPWRTG